MGQNQHYRPGAKFSFQPSNSISSCERPDFSKLPNKSLNHPAGIMANDEPTSRFGAARPNRAKSPDSDTDIDALINGFASLKSTGPEDVVTASFGKATQSPQFGHPTKMMSSRKQKANVFIHQKNRPEHHLGTKISGPRAPIYQDRKPAPLPVFNSNQPRQPKLALKDEVFYTDPTKADADLKALLEGGMEDDDEEEEEEPKEAEEVEVAKTQIKVDDAEKTTSSPEPTVTPKSTTPKQPKRKKIAKDGKIENLKVQLLPHQVEGVEWMRGRELGPIKKGTVPKGGLLADDMGLGKTLQTISLILLNRKPELDSDNWKKHFEKVEKTTLVVAPLALIRQWEQEIKDKVTKQNGLKVLVHHGPQRTKKYQDLALYDVVITTYQILVSDHANSSGDDIKKKTGCFALNWWRVVLDEAHTIKNRAAKSTKACYELQSEYRWCLSGTPMQNNLDELQSLVRFLRIKPYDDIRQWKEHIDKPMKNGKGHIAIGRLHSILRCFMKRRTKDILRLEGALNPGGKEALKAVGEGEKPAGPAFKPTERKVVTISSKLSAAERRFYDRLEERTDMRVREMMQEKLSYASAFTLLLRLRQVCDHPKLVEGKLKEDKDAMTTDSSQSQRSQDNDMDAMADLFSGMGIDVKKCNVCALELPTVDNEMGRDTCGDCLEDMALFQANGSKKKKKQKKPKKQKKLKHKENAETSNTNASRRRPRNRQAIIDSDDEEADGSWLVGEDDRGKLRLGKAGGEDDENAEGGGDSIGSEDSEDDESQDQSRLDSFVVDDEAARKETGYRSADEKSDDDDDSLVSLSTLTKQMASQTLRDKSAALESSDSNDSTSEEDSDLDSSTDETDDDGDNETKSGITASAKIREISRILGEEAQEHKFIIFSQFTSMLDLIEPFLQKDKFKFTRYDGSMKNDAREESLRQLRENPKVRVLLCSLKCGSLGLNLTAATRVIIVEPFWNPFVEEQAIDRVHRLTQTIDVIVYKLTVADTVEARIIDLQEKKRLLAEHAIESGAKKDALKLGLKELIDLFKPGGQAVSNGVGYGGAEDQHDLLYAHSQRSSQSLTRPSGKTTTTKRSENSVYGRRW